LDADQVLIHAGRPVNFLYLITNGYLKITNCDHSGGYQVIGLPGRGDLVGFDGIGTSVYLNQVTSLTPIGVIAIPYRRPGDLTRTAPGLAEAILGLVSQQAVQAQAALNDNGARSVESRLAGFLLDLEHEAKAPEHTIVQIELFMPRRDIASYLGTTTESVSRSLARLARKGLIEFNGRQVRVLNRHGLRRVQELEWTRRSPRQPHRQSGNQARCPTVFPPTPWSVLTDRVENVDRFGKAA